MKSKLLKNVYGVKMAVYSRNGEPYEFTVVGTVELTGDLPINLDQLLDSVKEQILWVEKGGKE